MVSSCLSMILPYKIYRIILFGTLLMQLTIGIKILEIYISNNYTKKELISTVPTFFLILSIVFLVISGFATLLMFLCLFGAFRGEYIDELVCLVMVVIFYILHIILGTSYFSKQAVKRKKQAYNIIEINSFILVVSYTCFIFCLLYPLPDIIAAFSIIGIGLSLISELIFWVISYIRRNKPIFDTE